MRIGPWLIALASVAHAMVYLVAAPEHVVDQAWPDHARFHVLQALVWVVGFDLVAAVIALIPLRRGERWALWALGAAFVALHVGYFAAEIALPDGAPHDRLRADGVLGAVLVLYAAGLAMSFWSQRPAAAA
jgi:hypothetical protein